MNMKQIPKLAVIGGGASGLAAAITAARRFGGKNVIILEKQSRVGRKLLATGNGRCNIGNRNISSDHYFGDNALIESVLSDFGLKQHKRFFASLGLLLKEDSEGRLYPNSNQASTVLDCMRNELQRIGVEEKCDFTIDNITKKKNCFEIHSGETSINAENIIFACGSKASPSLGSDDSGNRILKSFGITPSPLFPSLSPVGTKEKYKILKGVRSSGSVRIIADGDEIRSKRGEIQFSDTGISGICVFECSRVVNEYLYFRTVKSKKVNNLIIQLDLMPDYNEIELIKYLRSCKSTFSGLPCEMILSGALNKKLSEAILTSTGIRHKLCSELDEDDLSTVADHTKNFTFTPEKTDSFKTAQVCAGGIGSDEVYLDTLMSRKTNGLYICGEMLNVDGDCGGYNLHFSFGSGIMAAKNIK